MEHMNRKYKPEDAMLRPHKETTLEKQQKARQTKKKPPMLEDEGILNKKVNERMRRKEALAKAMNKIHDPDIA